MGIATLVHSQIWLNLRVDDRQFGYTTQLEKENPDAPGFIDLAQLQANWNSSTKKSTSGDGAREIAVE